MDERCVGKYAVTAAANVGAAIEADVVVVGGGGAELACAVTAASSGAKTILLEKNPQLGGTTWLSIGSITAANTRFQKKKGIRDTPIRSFLDAIGRVKR